MIQGDLEELVMVPLKVVDQRRKNHPHPEVATSGDTSCRRRDTFVVAHPPDRSLTYHIEILALEDEAGRRRGFHYNIHYHNRPQN
jgi:hypothetical protein